MTRNKRNSWRRSLNWRPYRTGIPSTCGPSSRERTTSTCSTNTCLSPSRKPLPTSPHRQCGKSTGNSLSWRSTWPNTASWLPSTRLVAGQWPARNRQSSSTTCPWTKSRSPPIEPHWNGQYSSSTSSPCTTSTHWSPRHSTLPPSTRAHRKEHSRIGWNCIRFSITKTEKIVSQQEDFINPVQGSSVVGPARNRSSENYPPLAKNSPKYRSITNAEEPPQGYQEKVSTHSSPYSHSRAVLTLILKKNGRRRF